MDVSKNCGTPKSSISIGFSIINHPFWGTLIFGKHPYETTPRFLPRTTPLFAPRNSWLMRSRFSRGSQVEASAVQKWLRFSVDFSLRFFETNKSDTTTRGHDWLVVEPTHLKKIRSSKWVHLPPKKIETTTKTRGHDIWCENTCNKYIAHETKNTFL